MGSLSPLFLLQIFWILDRTYASSPVMTHTSMDVGNIISIIIPESPDTTINVDQLTADFRRQLERIHKQSRVTKLEHGLVTLKNVLPEMSREEKKNSLPLIRRVLQTRRLLPPKNSTKESSKKRIQKNNNTRRSPAKNNTASNNNNYINNNNNNKSKPKNSKIKPTQKKTSKQIKKQKPGKTPKAYVIEDSQSPKIENFRNDDSNREYFIINEHYRQPDWKSSDNRRRTSMVKMNQADKHYNVPLGMDFDKNEEAPRQSWERDINRPNRRASQFPCSEGEDESKVRSTKDIRGIGNGREKSDDCDKGIGADGQPIGCHKETDTMPMEVRGREARVFNYPVDVAYPVEDDELKGYERILQSPQVSIDQINSTGFGNPLPEGENSMTKRKVHGDESSGDGVMTSINRKLQPKVKASEYYELNEKRRNLMIDDQIAGRVPYSGNVEAIPRVGRQFVDFDNKNFEIRIQRSVDNHLVRGTTIKPGNSHRGVHSTVDYVKRQEKVIKGQKVKKMKKPWKSYPRSLDKQLIVEKAH